MLLSIVIPSYRDPCLVNTIMDVLAKAGTNPEVIVVIDGYEMDRAKIEQFGVRIIQFPQRVGMRRAINAGVDASVGEYIMKCDEHCMFDEGFDAKLLQAIEDNWVVVPRRYRLDIEKWEICKGRDGIPIDYERLVLDRPDKIGGCEWVTRQRQRKDIMIDETMVFQGSCWLMSRKHWNWLGGLQEEGYGSFAQEAVEIALKTWLGGGKVMVNKNTWYAHKHRKFKRAYPMEDIRESIAKGNLYSKEYWLNNQWKDRMHDLSWLMKRFGIWREELSTTRTAT